MTAADHPEASAWPLAASRVGLGVLLLLRTTPVLAPLDLWYLRGVAPLLGWPEPGWRGHVAFALPAVATQGLCIVRTLAAAAFLLGYHTRAAGIVAGVAGFSVLTQDPFAFIFTFHLLYLGTIVLAFTDAGSTWALRPEPVRALRSSALLMRTFVASIYFWAAIYKLRPDWLDGRTLALYHADLALHGRVADTLLATETRRSAVAWIVALLELSLPPLLLLRRTLPLGLLLAFVLHAGIQVVGAPDLLGFEMFALLVALWPFSASGGEPRTRS